MSARKLHISPALSLPQDFQTSTLVVYGGKGMGKTNLGSVLVEELAAAGLRFSVLDPMGVWWGLRHSEDGKGPGIAVLILGGIHGDIPIEPTAGAVVADLVVDEDVSVVIDISRRPDGTMWSIGERVRFVTDYAKRLYQRQGEKRRPLMQVIDEAARFIPQVLRKGEEQVAACMGAVAVLVEEGRNVGVGVSLITQRSARLNKDVAELADCMVAFRTVGPNSRRAVLDWLGEHVEKERLKDLDQKVRTLPLGTALVVSPGWLEYEGVVPMRMRATFDSSATPKRGEERRASGRGARPDLAKYRERMAATIERAQADDPKALKKRIADLEREIKATKARPVAADKQPPKAVTKTVTIDRPVITRSQLAALKEAAVILAKLQKELGYKVDWFDNQVVRPLLAVLDTPFKDSVKPTLVEKPGRHVERIPVAADSSIPRGEVHLRHAGKTLGKIVHVEASTDGAVTPVGQRILNGLAELEVIGAREPPRALLAFFAGYTHIQSTGFVKALGALRSAAMVEYTDNSVALTELGRRHAAVVTAPTSAAELQDRICRMLGGPSERVLRPLIERRDGIPRDVLAQLAGYGHIQSTGFVKAIGRLRTLGFIAYRPGGIVVPQPVLFLET
jgi:hypothetical protein